MPWKDSQKSWESAAAPCPASSPLLVLPSRSARPAAAPPLSDRSRTESRPPSTAIDTSAQNNAISLDEWDHASFALFHAADRNNNNFIDADELQGEPAIAQDTFLQADTDHDGRLSVYANSRSCAARSFTSRTSTTTTASSTSNSSCSVVMEQVGWVDRNHDGRIELSELRESLVKAFEQLDADHDGKLSAAEATHMPAAEFKADSTRTTTASLHARRIRRRLPRRPASDG